LIAGKGSVYAPNLHAFWDQAMVERVMNGRTPAQTASALLENKAPSQGLPPDFAVNWAEESHVVALRIYRDLNQQSPRKEQGEVCDPSIRPVPLTAGYADLNIELATDQLLRAGLRLAALVNSIAAGGEH
jgi:hypothetical protein